MQYGTVAKMRVKPGKLDTLVKMSRSDEGRPMSGYVGTVVYQMDADPNEVYLAVIFESKEAYLKNAESPEQHAEYLEYMTCLEGDPEWHDGVVLFSEMK